ncbi:MAG TPA: hypothetical protein VL095_01325, partial [Flavisolibacter sp.]|nr:hypothetical protein [Flavisolibacter sp.]
MNIRITKPLTRAAGVFAVAMMAALILFASCTVRKSFQTLLNIPVAKPLNLNKATVSNGNTCYVTANENKVVNKIANPSVDAGIFILDDPSQVSPFSIDNTIPVLPRYKVTQQLPS